ncbi:MAG: lytic transglycosylase domain-containing protein [Blastomonas sp.]
MRKAILAGCAFAALSCQPALAESSSADYYSARFDSTALPQQLDQTDRAYFRSIFAAIHDQQWDRASALIAERENSPDKGLLHEIAKAELYLDANSPRVELGPLMALLSESSDIPQAEQLGRLAEKRGAMRLPDRPQTRQLVSFAPSPRRGKPRSVNDGSMSSSYAGRIQDRIVNDDPQGARSLLEEVESSLSESTLTEWRQKVAWSYYIENQDHEALSMARLAATGSGAWLADAHWVAGLAAWRLDDCSGASQAFTEAARNATNEELRAASFYWASRAQTRCRRPDLVAASLQGASQYGETFYGLLAQEQLGLDRSETLSRGTVSDSDWKVLQGRPNVRRALALNEIGESQLADETLRHDARIAGPEAYQPLLHLARELGMVQTQLWMAHNGPSGSRPEEYARFPNPRWAPRDGWRVDPALVYAHSLQESQFQSNARSPADARGLMQVRPGTAQDMARGRGESIAASDLYQPAVNLEYGQRYLEELRDMPQTQGLLPKVIAAYNAGPAPVGRWNDEVRDQGDPLLFIESIPYYETRAYVGIILRNYWMYEKQAGVHSQSALGLAQGLWPRFPRTDGIELVQLGNSGRP